VPESGVGDRTSSSSPTVPAIDRSPTTSAARPPDGRSHALCFERAPRVAAQHDVIGR